MPNISWVSRSCQAAPGHSPVTEATAKHFTRDLTGSERSVLVPIVAIILLFGVLPGPIVNLVEPTAKAAMTRMQLTDPVAPAKGEK